MKTETKTIPPFQFKQFAIKQEQCAMKVGTDGVLLGAWTPVEKAKKILDIGTGTGVIAIMLAQRNIAAKVAGIEIDAKACAEAKENMDNAPWSERLSVINDSIQDYAKTTREKYDLIVSNPPFFSGGTLSNQQDKTSVRHTIKLPHGDLLRAVKQLLKSNGKFCVVLPYIEGLRFQEIAQDYNVHCTKMTEVYPKAGKDIERLLMCFELTEQPMDVNQLVIQKEERNDWTADYIALTKDFYLNM